MGGGDLNTVEPLRHHPLKDPLTRRAFTKPRGYPGDAKTMDLAYFDQVENGFAHYGGSVSETGKRVTPHACPSPLFIRKQYHPPYV